MLTLSDPAGLWLLSGLVIVWWSASRSRTHLNRTQARWSAICRSVILSALVLAMAGPHWAVERDETAVLFLVDESASVGPGGLAAMEDYVARAREEGAGERIGVMAFAEAPRVLADFGKAEPGPITPAARRQSTDLVRALEFAGAMQSDRFPTRFVLLTDGLASDEGAAVAAAARLAASGVPLDAVRIRTPFDPEVEIAAVHLPGRLRPREPFDLRVDLRATSAMPATLRVFQNGVLAQERTIEVSTGASTERFQNLSAEDGISTFRVEIQAENDTLAANNVLTETAAVGGASRILLIDPEPHLLSPVVSALEQAGFRAEVRAAREAPEKLEELGRWDLVILSDTDAATLGRERMDLLKSWVSDLGGGLLITGGENAFAAGGYYQTPLADLAPVRVDFTDSAEVPVVAMMIVLDRSGSMSAAVGGQTKMELADQGAVRAMDVLQSKDLFGVLAVDTRVHPILPLARITEKQAAAKRIEGIDAGGGGIYVFTALGAAYRALADADAQIKHVILFSDAADAEEKEAPSSEAGLTTSSLDVAAAMLSKRITVSVVALGNETDRDTTFLRNLAARGGGRFYLTSDALTLPRIFAEEALRATRSNLVEEAFLPKPVLDADEIRGVDWESAPFLLGYNATLARDQAEILLATEADEPLLAQWRYGLGRVAAFTSDLKGRWSADWLAWPEFGKLLNQLARGLTRRDAQPGLSARIEEEGGRLAVEIEAIDREGNYRNSLPVGVVASREYGGPVKAVAEQIAPGKYRAVLDLPADQSAIVSASAGPDEAPLVVPWNGAAADEFRVLRDPAPFLESLVSAGGGKLDPTPAEIFRPTGRKVTASFGLAPIFLALALVLIPVDIWIRRRSWEDRQAARPIGGDASPLASVDFAEKSDV